MLTMMLETSLDDISVKMYDGPVPTPCVIHKAVMDQKTKQGDECIFTEDPNAPEATGIMMLEGNTATFLHRQGKNAKGDTLRYPRIRVNDKTVDTNANETFEFKGDTILTYEPAKTSGMLTVTVKEELKVVKEEEEDVMSGQEDNKENKEEEEELMSDEDDNKDNKDKEDAEDPNRVKHANFYRAEAKALASINAVKAKEESDEAAKKAADLKAAQDKADKISYDEMSAPIKEMSDAIEAMKIQLNGMVKAKFDKMYDEVDSVPRSMIPEPVGMIKEVGRTKHVRMFEVATSITDNEAMVNRMTRMAVWGNNMNDKVQTRINLREDTGKVFAEYCKYNPDQNDIFQAALLAYNLAAEVKAKEESKKRKNDAESDGNTGGSKRGGKAPRKALAASTSRKITKELKKNQ
jgi:hypothetical protein